MTVSLSLVLGISCSLLAASTPQVLTLEGAIQLAKEKTRDVIRAKADLVLADVEHVKAVSAILPKLDLSMTAVEDFWGSYIIETRNPYAPLDPTDPILRRAAGPYLDFYLQDSSAPQINARLSARQLLFDGGRWWLVIARVEDVRDVRRAILSAVESNARMSTVQSFYNVAKANQGVHATEEQVRLTEAQFERARARFEAGKVRKTDMVTAERNLASDRVELARRRFNEASRRRALNIVIGRAPDTEFSMVLPRSVLTSTNALPMPPLRGLSDLLEHTAEARPELVNARATLASLKKNIGIQASGHWPSMWLIANYMRGPTRRPDRIFDDPTENYHANLGLEMRWNLFNGRATDAAVDEAEIQVKKQQASLEDLERRVKEEVLNRLGQLQLFFDVYQLAREGVRAADETLRLAQGLYQQGRWTALELRDAQLGLTRARLRVMEARFDIEIAKEELRRAVGAQTFEELTLVMGAR